MGRLLHIRRHRPLPEVEAQIALLSDELPLTAMFVAAMQREGRPRAAVGVIEEQRESLRRAQTRMLRSLSAKRRRRIQAAMSGALAAVMLASGSYAAVHILNPATPQSAELLSRATAKIEEAKSAESATEFSRIVAEVSKSILALGDEALADPQTQSDLATILGRAQTLVASAPNAAELLAKVRQIAKDVDVKPVEAEEPNAEPAPSVTPPEQPAP